MSELIEFEEEEFDTSFNGQTIRRLAKLLIPYKWGVLGFLFTVMVVSGLDSYFTYLSARIIDEGIIAKNVAVLTEILTQYAALVLVQAVFVFAFIYLAGILGERIRYDLRKSLFHHLQTLSLPYYNRTPVGWIISRVTSDTDRVAELVTWGLLDVTWSIFNIVTALFFMSRINWQLTLIVMLIVPVIIVVATIFQRKIIVQYRDVRRINSKLTGSYNETITGVRVIKALDREDAEPDRIRPPDRRHVPRRLPGGLVLGLVPADGAADLVVCDGRRNPVRGSQRQRRRHQHRRHPGVHLVHRLHDLADPGDGACVRRDAAGDRFGRAHLLAAGLAAGRGGQGRGARTMAACTARSCSTTWTSTTRKASRS